MRIDDCFIIYLSLAVPRFEAAIITNTIKAKIMLLECHPKLQYVGRNDLWNAEMQYADLLIFEFPILTLNYIEYSD